MTKRDGYRRFPIAIMRRKPNITRTVNKAIQVPADARSLLTSVCRARFRLQITPRWLRESFW